MNVRFPFQPGISSSEPARLRRSGGRLGRASLTGLSCIFFCIVHILSPQICYAQAVKFRIPLYVNDNGNKRDTLRYGISSGASYCIDSTSQMYFGSCDSLIETELPPPPPTGVFDVRFVDTRLSAGACLGQGTKRNFHQSTDTTQIDTFKVLFQPGPGGYPIKIRWPQGLSRFCDSMFIKDPFGVGPPVGFKVDMLAIDSLVISNTAFTSFLLIMYRPNASAEEPTPPTLSTPSDNATNQNTTLTLSWQAVSGTTVYRVQVSSDSLFSTLILNDTSGGTSKQVSGLNQSTKYFWRVNSNSVFLNGCFSAPFRFTTILLPPSPPTLLSPSQGQILTTTSPALRWSSISGSGITYRVLVATDTGFTKLVKDTTFADTSIQMNSLDNCVVYYWKVRGINSAGAGSYSTARNFRPPLLTPAVPVLSSPVNNASNVTGSPTLLWTGRDACSDNYTLQVAKDTSFASTSLVTNVVVTDTSRSIGPLTALTDYFWKVRAFNVADTSAYSEIRKFTTALFPPSAPSLVSPSNGDTISTDTVTLRWTKATNNPATYQVQIDTNINFINPIFNDSTTITDTTVRVGPLDNCSRFYWRVRARNTAGNSSFTSSRLFRTPRAIPKAPTLVNPADRATNVPDITTLSWLGVPCGEQYILHLATDSNFTTIVRTDTLTSTSKQIGPLNSATTYFWRVSATNSIGAGSFSVRRFSTTALTRPPIPTLRSPSNGQEGVSIRPTLCWDSAARATSYRLQVSFDSNFSAFYLNDSTITTFCKEIGPLLNSRAYYWRASAKNDSGTSGFSEIWKFLTLFPPASPTLISPENNAEDISISPTFVWSIPSGAETYQLQVAGDSLFNNIFYSDSNLTLVSWSMNRTLMSFTNYYWRVRAKNSAGWGLYSSVFAFRTHLVGVANWSIPLVVKETGPASDTIFFGINPSASFGIDPPLGEYELPPPPPQGFFDVRFVDIPGRPSILGQGLRVSFLPFSNYRQIDTFAIKYQPGTGVFPMVFTCPSSFIRVICDSMVLIDEFGGSTVHFRMDQDSIITITNQNLSSLLIIKYGARPLSLDIKPGIIHVPKGFSISQNYPNPFNPSTQIQFSTDRFAQIKIFVYDVVGREIAKLTHASFFPGIYSVAWNGLRSDGSPMPSGIYYLCMIAHDLSNDQDVTEPFTAFRKMILLK